MNKMKIPENLPEILFFIFGVVGGYIYGGFIGILIGGGLMILLIIRQKLRAKIKW